MFSIDAGDRRVAGRLLTCLLPIGIGQHEVFADHTDQLVVRCDETA
jgi:hypothetical protein